jgi:hypothetical protein
MSVSGRGTGHYRRAPEPRLSRAPLVSHPHPAVARTGRGQLQVVHRIRERIHERGHPVSWSVAELLRKERKAMSVSASGIGGHRVQDGITSIVHRVHLFLDRLFCPRTQSTHSNGSDRRLRHTPSQSSLHSEGSSRPSSPADLTHQRKDEDEGATHERERNWGLRQQKWTHPIFATKPRLRTLPRPILASEQTQSRIPAPLLGRHLHGHQMGC